MSLFSGRLGLERAQIPHSDRHGLLWLSRGRLSVEDGSLTFSAAQSDLMAEGSYGIPYQSVSMILLGPGTSVTHDVFRLLARHGVLLAAIGEGGVKLYTAPPMGRQRSSVARRHAELWVDPSSRLDMARKLYVWRFGTVTPHKDIAVLRGIEGGRVKASYQAIASKVGIPWRGRRYDRSKPTDADLPNQAINHAATFIEAAAEIAVAATGALPPLGFIHEDSSSAFSLDIADLYRTDVTIPLAFSAAKRVMEDPSINLERLVRFEAARTFKKRGLIPTMIERIQELLGVNDRSGDT